MDLAALMARAAAVPTVEAEVEGIKVTLRAPSAAANSAYALAWRAGQRDEALAGLLRHCVVDSSGQPCLTDEQALILAKADDALTQPLVRKINEFSERQKKPHAPGTDAVPDQPAPGAPAV